MAASGEGRCRSQNEKCAVTRLHASSWHRTHIYERSKDFPEQMLLLFAISDDHDWNTGKCSLKSNLKLPATLNFREDNLLYSCDDQHTRIHIIYKSLCVFDPQASYRKPLVEKQQQRPSITLDNWLKQKSIEEPENGLRITFGVLLLSYQYKEGIDYVRNANVKLRYKNAKPNSALTKTTAPVRE